MGYAQIYWFYNIIVNLLFLARFCKTLFLPEFLSNQLEILTQHSQSSQERCYNFSKTSIVFVRLNLRIFWITILLNGKRQFLLTCKVSRYSTMLLFKCKMQYLLTCKVRRYCLFACMAVGLVKLGPLLVQYRVILHSMPRGWTGWPYVQTYSISLSLDLIIKIHLSNVSIPGQRRRRWPSIEPISCIWYGQLKPFKCYN